MWNDLPEKTGVVLLLPQSLSSSFSAYINCFCSSFIFILMYWGSLFSSSWFSTFILGFCKFLYF